MFTRAIRPSVNAARRVAIPAPRYTSQRTNDPDADKATGTTPQEMASSTLEYMKKQHPDSWSDTIREHTNAPYIKDSVQGPLGALAQGAKKAANALAEAAATDHEDVQGNLSDKGAKAEQARRASLNTESEEAVRADRELRH
ncbi:hypothetical protein BN14_05788 [Rhizoctonia solani AG-1 IB]|uniref:Uncharacterized protein n=1 Tax=Thanatephorus cucumeris (strain AG1-IB / isolate 7/3/14) TaxID=1108050 RepID=M5BWS2_THACB|nr:hypothetical protein BN14_05788 [Rhizoctonia solani AG-1 IB]